MKKRRYRATNVNQANWEKINSLAAGQQMVFGVDVAKDDFFGVLMDTDRQVIDTIKWVHPQQTQVLGEGLVGLHARRLAVVMEPSSTYGDVLRRYLSGLGLAVYRVSPKRVHDAAEVYDGVPSLHDAKAAYIIARAHLDGASAPWSELSASRRDHHALVAELDLYKGQHQANLNRLEAYLNRYWPEVVRLLDLDTVSLHALIGEYGDPKQVTRHRQAAAAGDYSVPRSVRQYWTVVGGPWACRAPTGNAICCRCWVRSCCARTSAWGRSNIRSLRWWKPIAS